MLNALHSPISSVPAGEFTLRRIWEVDVGISYQCAFRDSQRDGLVILRTISGEGFLKSANGRKFNCEAETLIAFRHSEIKSYGCVKPR